MLGYTSPEDLLSKLRDEVKDLVRAPDSSKLAFNVAITAWHLADWFWYRRVEGNHHYKAALGVHKLEDLHAWAKRVEPAMGWMQGVANGSKHLVVKSPNSLKVDTSLRGDFSRDWDPVDFNTVRWILEDRLNTQSADLLTQARIALDFWERTLAQYP